MVGEMALLTGEVRTAMGLHRRDATYAKLVLALDPKTGQVTDSIIFETTGNTNHFKFRNPSPIDTNPLGKMN